VSYIKVIRLNYMLFELTCSLFLFRVVLEQVVGDELDGVFGAFLGALSEGLEQNWNHGLVEVGANWQVLSVVGVTYR
jgi:hypothetical protein